MEKTITIDGQTVRLKSTGAIAKRYKAQFRRDLLVDMLKLGTIKSAMNKKGEIDFRKLDLEIVDFEVFYDLIWTYAKTADDGIADPITWLDSFSVFPLQEVISKITDLIEGTFQTLKKK